MPLHHIESGFISNLYNRTGLHTIMSGIRAIGGAPVGGGTGLLDLYPSALVAYSFRRLRDAYSGSAVRIRRESDDVELDVGFDGSGNFDEATAAAHIGSSNGFIVTWYDQSGNANNVTEATEAEQPLYLESGINGLPTARFASGAQMSVGSIAFTGTDVSAAILLRADDDAATNLRILVIDATGTDFTAPSILLFSTSGSGGAVIRSYSSGELSATSTLTDEQVYTLMSIADGANHTMYTDGVAGTPAAFSSTIGDGSSTIYIGLTPTAGNFISEYSEVIIWPSDQTANV
jgi:hypothetical protein